jgi:hypothetical protein
VRSKQHVIIPGLVMVTVAVMDEGIAGTAVPLLLVRIVGSANWRALGNHAQKNAHCRLAISKAGVWKMERANVMSPFLATFALRAKQQVSATLASSLAAQRRTAAREAGASAPPEIASA